MVVEIPRSVSLPTLISVNATTDPLATDRHPVTLQEQSSEIITTVLKYLSLGDQACLALTCKELAAKICFTKEHKIASERKERKHFLKGPNHIKGGDVAPWILFERGHRTYKPLMGVLACNLGNCFLKNFRIKKWAFDVKKRALRRRELTLHRRKLKALYRARSKFLTMEEELQSLVPGEPKSKENGFIFAQLLEDDTEINKAAEKTKGTKSIVAKGEKETQGGGGDRKRRRLA